VDELGLVQFVADIRIGINIHTFFKRFLVCDTGKNKTSNKNYHSESYIV